MKPLKTLFFALLASFSSHAQCDKVVRMDIIMAIESSGNPRAYNGTSPQPSYGLYQITKVCLGAYNKAKGTRIPLDSLYTPSINESIARWYLYTEIPRMLRAIKKPVTVRNVVISYNAGIRYVKTGGVLPEITTRYLEKYDSICATSRRRASQGSRTASASRQAPS